MKTKLKKLGFYLALTTSLTLSTGFVTAKNADDVSPKDLIATHVEKESVLELKESTSKDGEVETLVDKIEEGVKEQIQYHQVIAYYLNVRDEANSESKIIDVLVKDWIVEVDKVEENGWLSLKDGGFINGKYAKELTLEEAEPLVEKQKTMEKPKPTFNHVVKQKPEDIVSSNNASESEVVTTVSTIKNDGSSNVDISESDFDLLARLVHAEAKGEPFDGKVAVAIVVLNRVDSSKFPNTIRDVIYQKGQFQPIQNGSINTPAGEESIRAVEVALNSKDRLNGSLYFYYPEYSSQKAISWFNTLETTAVIGNHVFKK